MKNNDKVRHFLCLAFSAMAVLSLVSSARANTEPAESSGSNGFDVSFTSIPLSAQEIVNPMRGLYTFWDQNFAPQPKPSLLSYKTFFWSDIETSPHHFDFSVIEQEVAKAVAVNGKFAFRVMSCNPPGAAGSPDNIGVPSDLVVLLKKGYFITNTSGTTSWRLYVPDYNDPIYISRGKDLIDALARRYDGNPRIAFMETGLIGSWGEGNYSQMPNPTPTGAIAPTFGTTAQIIDYFCARFPHTQLISPTGIFQFKPTQPDEAAYAAIYHNALEYVLRKHPRIGIFRDSLGEPINTSASPADQNWLAAPFNDQYVVAAGGAERWKYAPFNAEWLDETALMSLGLTDVPAYHVGMISNGSLGKTPFPPAKLQQLETCGKLSGYRFQLDRISRQSTSDTRRLDLTSYWENVGVTPVYEPWLAVYFLKDIEHNKVIWYAASSLDLRRLLPTNGTPLAVHDVLQIPRCVRPGTYQLSIVVEDPTRYYKAPLALAVEGAQPEGGHKIAKVTIKEVGER
jgi:hypothetical protein